LIFAVIPAKATFVVMPAKAGIQVMNDQKPPYGRLLSLKATCGWLTHGRFLFFARAKKRNQKKARPGARETFLCSSPHRALANSPGAYYAPRAQTRARLTAPGGAAVLGARYGDPETTISSLETSA